MKLALIALLACCHSPEARSAAAMHWLAQTGARSMPMDHPTRTTWKFLPGERHGMRLSAMTPEQRDAAMSLMRSILSAQGYDTATGIFLLDAELRDRAIARGRPDPSRDPDQYAWAVWGDPGEGSWATRVEGHHFSLNYTATPDGERMTPLFLGAAPMRIEDGPRQGTAPLEHIDRTALALRNSLNAEQTAACVLSTDKPHDILLGPGREHALKTRQGLPVSDLSSPQRGMLLRLLGAYTGIFQSDLSVHARTRLLAAGPASMSFAWIGGTTPDAPRYWRLHGDDWIIEFDNVGSDPDHVHTVWHDLRGNFGADVLKAHIEQHEH